LTIHSWLIVIFFQQRQSIPMLPHLPPVSLMCDVWASLSSLPPSAVFPSLGYPPLPPASPLPPLLTMPLMVALWGMVLTMPPPSTSLSRPPHPRHPCSMRRRACRSCTPRSQSQWRRARDSHHFRPAATPPQRHLPLPSSPLWP
jgi:hypothetical protein